MNKFTNAIFDEWLRQFCSEASHPFVRDSESMIKHFLALANQLPARYEWHVMDNEGFKKRIKDCTTASEINSVYWRDLAGNIEAYGIMALMRTSELLNSAVASLNKKEVLPAAIIARGVLEIAVTVITNSNLVSATVRQVLNLDASTTVVGSQDLEKILAKMIHGTRIGNPEEHLKQTNILTYIQRIAKKAPLPELVTVYEFLCDATHPNVVGNARFWGVTTKANDEGVQVCSIEREAEFLTATRIREQTLWALGWSAVCVSNGFQIGQETVGALLRKWPK